MRSIGSRLKNLVQWMPRGFPPFRVTLAYGVLTLVVLWVYARYVEPRWIVVTRHEVVVSGLPASLDGLKVVQISDLHRGRGVRDKEIGRVVRMAVAEHPDLVVLTGDYSNWPPANGVACARLLRQLSSRYGVYAVLGNHDWWQDAHQTSAALRRQHVVVLTNRNVGIAPGLFLIGVDDAWGGKPDPTRAWRGVPAGSAQIVITHSPLAVPQFDQHRCVVLTGHTHGGEVRIPFVPRSKLPGLRGWKHISGWHREGNAQVYINRGIGVVNPLCVRFRCRPELSVFVLRSTRG